MTKTSDQGKDEVAKLCRYFATNRQPFLAPGVKEAHVRQSLIDPFFEALGWDVANKTMTAPQYREVIPEDSLDVEGEQKAPDYAFRVGTLTKFFAEAKKCGVNIDKDPAPAYQLRRYGWSAKVAVSLLTDFEELGVYDCALRPRPSDKASHARILYFRCEEYPDRWRELWNIFSREAVWSGQFDQYAASKRKRGTSEVDVEFLKEIEAWRDALARNFALRNKDLDSDDLNRAVQLTIDRVVFLRMAEDRGLEPYQQLLKLCERPDIYSRFMRDLSRRADQKYNSGLFHFQKEPGVSEDPDRITPKLDLDDKVFKPILESLYFEHGSPYHFGVMPVEILGTVYERFLGKVIRLTPGHQAKVEEKPEVRKAGGVYYTPAYIVDYIVKHTVGKQIEGRSPAHLAGSAGVPPASSPSARSAGVPPASSASARSAGVSPANKASARAGSTSGDLRIRNRGRLPHWERERATYFITFRLADSLPQSVLQSYELERQAILRNAERQERDLTDDERRRLAELFSERIETHLDSGAGACHLARSEIAQLVADTLRHFDGERYTLWAWCVMPNHVHVVAEFHPGETLDKVLHSWKSFTAHKANELLGSQGEFWQREYYDHLIRNEQELASFIRYAAENPPNARLNDWPWVWTRTAGVSPASSPSAGSAGVPPASSVSAGSAGVSPASSVSAGSAGVSPANSAPASRGHTFRVLDMACGSGSFLLGAYQCLLDHCLKWYSDQIVGSHGERLSRRGSFPVYKDPRTGAWRLTIEEKKRILTTHIFGVDIDPQAVEVSKLSLLLKVLEGETDQSLALSQLPFGDRALPNLADNIKCGNSLIGPDYFTGRLFPVAPRSAAVSAASSSARSAGAPPALFASEQEYRRVNPLDWNQAFPDAMKAGGFDCIIGNPPYIRMETFKELKAYLKATYASHDERSDLYTYFIERAHKLLRSDGALGMIVSNKFLRANYGRPLRVFLGANAGVERVVDFAGLPVFQGATVRTIVLLTSRRKNTEGTLYSPPLPPATFLNVVSGSLSVEDAIAPFTYQVAPHALAEPAWGFSRPEADDLLVRLQGRSISLAKYCDGKICMGVKSGLTEAFVIDGDQRKAILKRNSKAGEIIKPFLNGRDVRRYHIDYNELYLIYTYHGVRIDQYPAVERYLNPLRGRLQKRATQQAWYELQQPQYNFSQYMDRPKIIFPDIATTPRFALDDTGFYSGNTTYFIPRRDLFLLALLNSRLGYWYFKKTCAGLEGKNETYLRFFGQYLENFPVRLLDSSKSGDRSAHDGMVNLVDSMLALHKQLAAAKSTAHKAILQRQMDATDAEIDRLVYDLYGLTEQEIAIVEGKTL